jgi:uncharacterized protein (DUF1501 family)
MSISRRSFVRYASLAAAGNAAGLHPFGALNGLAATPQYKALVCIFMYGGNDSNNTLVPFDTKANGANGYSAYSGIRGPLALPASSLATLDAGANGNYGVHPSLGQSSLYPGMPSIQSLFNQNKLAFVANIGTLINYTTPTQYQNSSVAVPVNLFSHPDQQLEWQNAEQSSAINSGWAGRIADTLAASYNPTAQIPLITSVYGDTVFCNGQTSTPVAVAPGNLAGGQCSEGPACTGRTATAQQLITFQSGLSLVQADNGITANAYKYMSILANAVQSVAPLQTQFPANNSLAAQLQQIAQIMQVYQALGVTRQIFFAGLGNFDTHANQLGTQAQLLSLLSPAMGAFYQATEELNLHDQVTTFTMSDFSRAMQPNSNYGSDHAWGGHHMVMGGAVQGGQIYGTYPTLVLAGPNDADVNGRWIPTHSTSQYAATLASWFGVSTGNLNTIFPSLKNFSTNNLGFV